jgi:hypothetical protein
MPPQLPRPCHHRADCERRMELLRGPLYYVLVLVAATLVFWRESPVRTAWLV